MSQPLQPLMRAKTLSQHVVEAIATDIRNGVLRPGDRVPTEPELSQRFGVSRTVVRESMQRLQASGLVETRHGIGTFVLAPAPQRALLADTGAEVTVRDVLEMLELRISVEVASAGLAATRRTEAHLAALRATLDEFARAHEAGANTTQADFQFHLRIAQATGNRYFEEVLDNLGRKTINYTGRSLPTAPAPDAALPASGDEQGVRQFGEPLARFISSKVMTMREHEDIFEAIRSGDAAAAQMAMFNHLDKSRERLRKIIDSGPAASDAAPG